ncbi:RHS repeat-associated core domain-containing protein [Streptomyces goshikiensis]|uniref:RHS repeat-associated core domain-containing protein n=1 Tax=Streptomyces goshikiensis TaxID=1942 RepID=UPI0036931072
MLRERRSRTARRERSTADSSRSSPICQACLPLWSTPAARSPGGPGARRGAPPSGTETPPPTLLRYPGQLFDAETGLHYNFNRYYDPATGRYISPDPLGLAPALNHYTYVPNPFTLWDPLGLAGCTADPNWGGRVVFVRDAHGRPSEMHATITRSMLDEGTGANPRLKPPGFIHGDENQARGHMLARMLGGSGDTLDNLFTITQNPTNTPHMRDLEFKIYDAVNGNAAQGVAGQTVQYSVYLEYTDDLPDSVPSRIYMQADGKDASTWTQTFPTPTILPSSNVAAEEPRD